MSKDKDFAKLSIEEALASLNTDAANGLSGEEALQRQQQYGFNEIPEKEESLFSRIAKRFWGPIPWMIELAAILSALAQKWEDFTIITILLLVNVIIDFQQEAKALSALKLLKEKLARKALAMRDGQWREIDARELVPGDVVKLRIGSIVPADMKLIDGDYLQLDQSALTGESMPVDKAAGDLAYGNAIVKMGEMVGLVTAIGLQTFFGRTAALVAQAEREQESHFQKAVINVGNYLIALSAVMVVLIVMVALFRHDPLLEILRFALVLTVASIPVALPAVLSVTMAVGAVRLARRQAIVSRLVAIEELAGVDVLCSDKTGTLTQNRMKLGEPVTFDGYDTADLLKDAGLASREENNDPLEMPIFQALKDSGAYEPVIARQPTQFIPFDPVRKRTEATIPDGDGEFVVTKGAPQAVLALCDGKDEVQAEANRHVQQFARKGYRTLGVAVKKKNDETFRFVGLLPFFDPPRDDSAQMIARAGELGLNVKMVTGDNQAIAEQIADVLGIEGEICDSSELKKEKPTELLLIADVLAETLYPRLKPDATPEEIKSIGQDVSDHLERKLEEIAPENGFVKKHESEIIEIIERAGGFAQVFPEDKYLIIDKLQKADHIVAMTGDGVNDAPALRKADAGIAVSGATDAARAAADLVLVLPGLSVIINALEEARMIFGRMKSYAIFRIAETIRVILFMTLAITVFNFYPVTAIMIIMLALLNDIPIMAIAYDNAKIEPQPVSWNMREVLTVSTVLGIAGVISSFTLFFIVEQLKLPAAVIQTIMFLKLDVAGHSTLYVTRSGDKHFWHKPYPSYMLFLPTIATMALGTLIACYGLFMAPIGWTYCGYIWAYAMAWFVFNDFVKVLTYKVIRKEHWLLAGRQADTLPA